MDTTTLAPARRALGAYLRERRDAVAVAPGARQARRRARGLRREEVAAAAGISTTWYTWLEQGRAPRVSPATLRAIGDALGLGRLERAHLAQLAAAADAPGGTVELTTRATASLRRLVDDLAPHAAYAVNGLWGVLHVNAAARRALGSFSARPGVTDNVLRRVFVDPDWRTRFAEWPTVADSVVAQFRLATGAMVADARWRALVGRLESESDEFRRRWARHALAAPPARAKLLRTAKGTVRYQYASLAPEGEAADVRVIVYTTA